jgi:hypothetical protein
MIDKQTFYEEHGVEEYYVYDPDNNHLTVFLRRNEMLRRAPQVAGFVSPRLGIRFDLSGPEMAVYAPDGRRFLSFEELQAERDDLQAERDGLQAERDSLQVERDNLHAECDNLQAERNDIQGRLNRARQRSARLAELSRKARRQQASPEELQELDRLEGEAPPA